MPELTRRRDPEAREECWPIYYDDVLAGAIAIRTGNPHDTEQWEWRCGFYPGSRPGECSSGTSESFEQARADFDAAWQVFLSKRTESDFQAWRDKVGVVPDLLRGRARLGPGHPRPFGPPT
jgi:hypothetical protein